LNLGGRVALVTGAGSGLGRSAAAALARHGAHVVLAGRRPERLIDAVQEIVSAGGVAQPLELDVRDAARMPAVLDELNAAGLQPSILVNNAAIPDARRAHRMDLTLVDAVIETNVRGPWVLTCELARRWIAGGVRGRVVNVSSMSAFHYEGEAAALYSVTKAALNRMTEVLAVEWARYGINVNAVAPGAFRTEMLEGMLERTGSDPVPSLPRRRLPEPPELDATLLYLLGPGAEAVTGTVVKVDDGQFHR
jgi:NAD(P)-dependent dehydrogenase (short-subunit alcohol dehydrogenase family)